MKTGLLLGRAFIVLMLVIDIVTIIGGWRTTPPYPSILSALAWLLLDKLDDEDRA